MVQYWTWSLYVYIHYADLTRGEWKVTSVLKEDQLGKPEERLREKMERLWPQRTETPTRATEVIVSQEEKLRREGEQAKEVRELKEQLRRAEQQAKEAKEREESMRRVEQQAKEAKELKDKLRRVEALEQAVELLKKTNASSQSVPPDSTVPQRGKKYQSRNWWWPVLQYQTVHDIFILRP